MSQGKTEVLNMRVLPSMKDRLAKMAGKENMSVTSVAESFLALSLTTLWKMQADETEVYMRSARLAMLDFWSIQAEDDKERALQETFFAALKALQESTGMSPSSEDVVSKMGKSEGFNELKEWLLFAEKAEYNTSPLSVIVLNELKKLDAE